MNIQLNCSGFGIHIRMIKISNSNNQPMSLAPGFIRVTDCSKLTHNLSLLQQALVSLKKKEHPLNDHS
jgi:hypothetical protein